jgi:prepilin-type N-terminal cleavage/methylation domain-containing protein
MTGRRDGFTLIEVLVTVVLLAVILTSLAGFTFTTARQAITVGDVTGREAAMLEIVNRYVALPYTALNSRQDTVGTGLNRFERRATVTFRPDSASATVEIRVRPMQRDTTPVVLRLVRKGKPPRSPLCLSGNCAP